MGGGGGIMVAIDRGGAAGGKVNREAPSGVALRAVGWDGGGYSVMSAGEGRKRAWRGALEDFVKENMGLSVAVKGM